MIDFDRNRSQRKAQNKGIRGESGMCFGNRTYLGLRFVIGKAQFLKWLPVIATDFSETIRIYRYL